MALVGAARWSRPLSGRMPSLRRKNARLRADRH